MNQAYPTPQSRARLANLPDPLPESLLESWHREARCPEGR